LTLRLKTSSTPVQTGIDALVGDVTVVSLVWCRVFVAMVTGGVGHGGARPDPGFQRRSAARRRQQPPAGEESHQ
jgi:hypothetical protein